jgi:hypothetical protein
LAGDEKWMIRASHDRPLRSPLAPIGTLLASQGVTRLHLQQAMLVKIV